MERLPVGVVSELDGILDVMVAVETGLVLAASSVEDADVVSGNSLDTVVDVVLGSPFSEDIDNPGELDTVAVEVVGLDAMAEVNIEEERAAGRLVVLLVGAWIEDVATMIELLTEDSRALDVPAGTELVPDMLDEWELTGQITCSAKPGPGVMGLHPGKAVRFPWTGSSRTDACSGHVRAKLTSSLSARYEQALITPLLSVYKQFFTASVWTSMSQPFMKSP